MGTNLYKPFFFRLAIEDILLLLQTTLLVNAKDPCMTNAYHFNRGRDTVKNHALRGHVIANVTARKPLFCFDACRLECRCISFNFKQSADRYKQTDKTDILTSMLWNLQRAGNTTIWLLTTAT